VCDPQRPVASDLVEDRPPIAGAASGLVDPQLLIQIFLVTAEARCAICCIPVPNSGMVML
jgi:hypothetical protein